MQGTLSRMTKEGIVLFLKSKEECKVREAEGWGTSMKV